jgi:uncharacterized membrane protein
MKIIHFIFDFLSISPELYKLFGSKFIVFIIFIIKLILGFCFSLPAICLNDSKKKSDDALLIIVIGCILASCIFGPCLGLIAGIISVVYVISAKSESKSS